MSRRKRHVSRLTCPIVSVKCLSSRFLRLIARLKRHVANFLCLIASVKCLSSRFPSLMSCFKCHVSRLTCLIANRQRHVAGLPRHLSSLLRQRKPFSYRHSSVVCYEGSSRTAATRLIEFLSVGEKSGRKDFTSSIEQNEEVDDRMRSRYLAVMRLTRQLASAP
jgi:hypothetical protein